MCYSKGYAGECTGRFVAELFIASDPKLPLVPAPHVIAAGEHGVALDWLAFESLAFGSPVSEVAGFEVEIQPLAVCTDG
jgi:hypothetical protein